MNACLCDSLHKVTGCERSHFAALVMTSSGLAFINLLLHVSWQAEPGVARQHMPVPIKRDVLINHHHATLCTLLLLTRPQAG